MSDSEALLKERDRLAHEVAKAAIRWRDMRVFGKGAPDEQVMSEVHLADSLVRYEKADRRAQAEATA